MQLSHVHMMLNLGKLSFIADPSPIRDREGEKNRDREIEGERERGVWLLDSKEMHENKVNKADKATTMIHSLSSFALFSDTIQCVQRGHTEAQSH